MRTGRWIGDLTPEPEPPKQGRWIARPQKPRWIAPTFGVVLVASQLPNWINILFQGGRHLPILAKDVAPEVSPLIDRRNPPRTP